MEALRKEEPPLVFIDESSSINTDLIRRYGRAPKGERVRGRIPRNTPPAHSIVGALGPEGLVAAMDNRRSHLDVEAPSRLSCASASCLSLGAMTS